MRLGHDALHLDTGRLIAPGVETAREFGDIGRALVAVEMRRLEDDGGDDGVQARRDGEQVVAVHREPLDVLELHRVQTAGEAGHDHAQLEDIGNLVVMAELCFPIAQPRDVDRLGDFEFVAVEDGEIVDLGPAPFVLRDAVIADQLQGAGDLRLDRMDGAQVGTRRFALPVDQREAAVGGLDHMIEPDPRDAALLVDFGNLDHQAEHGVDEIVGRKLARLREHFAQRFHRAGFERGAIAFGLHLGGLVHAHAAFAACATSLSARALVHLRSRRSEPVSRSVAPMAAAVLAAASITTSVASLSAMARSNIRAMK